MTTDAAGNVQGVSVNAGVGPVEEIAQGIPHGKVGVTTAGDIRAAGGTIRPDPLPDNPLHCLVGGAISGGPQRPVDPDDQEPLQVR